MCKKCKVNDSINNDTNPRLSKAIFKNKIELENSNKLNGMQGNTSEKSCSKLNVSKDNRTITNTNKGKTQNKSKDTKE